MVDYVPLIGLEVATTSLVGRYVGAKAGAAANRVTYSGLKIGWMYSALIGLLFLFLPGVLADIFRPEAADATAASLSIFDAARPHAIFMIRLAILYIMVEVFLVVYAGALRGAGDTLWVMFASALMNWAAAIALYVTAYVFQFSPRYAWAAIVCVYCTAPILFRFRWKSGKWRSKVMLK